MQSDRRIGIELPLRILTWREADDVLLGYRDPCELSSAYDVAAYTSTLEQMATLLDALTMEAAGEPPPS
jgi:uncharacterized protein (DUF302 family)